jgi:hypothetical protein
LRDPLGEDRAQRPSESGEREASDRTGEPVYSVYDRAECVRLPVGRAHGDERLLTAPQQEFVDKSGLSDPRLSGDRDEAWWPVQGTLKQLKFTVATDQAGHGEFRSARWRADALRGIHLRLRSGSR